MRIKDITGKWVSNAIAYCHCPKHEGGLTRQLAYDHKCLGKKCKHLEVWNEKALQGKKYKNRR